MAICSNPDCPHKERTGRSAEYREGITNCPECGAHLTANPANFPDKNDKTNSDLIRKVLFTIGLIIFYRLLCIIPLPGVDLSGLPDSLITRYFRSANISICALGLMPYINAYLFVEIFSLVIPSLKRWRGEKHEGRRKLTLTARWFALVLCLVQGLGIAISLSRMTAPDGSMLAVSTGPGFKVMVVVTLTACVFISLFIADLITSKGIGNGISMIILAGLGIDIFSVFINRFSHTSGYGNFMEDTFGVLLIFFAAGVVIYFMESGEYNIKVKLKNDFIVNLPFKYNTSGIIPASFAVSIAMMPASVMYFTDSTGFFEYFRYGSWIYYLTYAIITTFLFFFFASLYYDPDKVLSFLKSKSAEPVLPERVSFEKLLDKKLTNLTIWSAIYLLIYSVLLNPAVYGYIVISGLTLIRVVSILLDVINEVKARNEYGNFAKINEMQKPYEAKFLKNLLEKHNIPCFLEGYYHRSLYYFFGPFIGISLYVQKDKESEAFKIISD